MTDLQKRDQQRPQPLFSIRRIDEFWFDVPNEGAFVGPSLKPSEVESQRTGQLLLYKEVDERKYAHNLFSYALMGVDQGTVTRVGSTELEHAGVLATSEGVRRFSCTPIEWVRTERGLKAHTCLCHRALTDTPIAPIFAQVVEMLEDRGGWRWSNYRLPRVVRTTSC